MKKIELIKTEYYLLGVNNDTINQDDVYLNDKDEITYADMWNANEWKETICRKIIAEFPLYGEPGLSGKLPFLPEIENESSNHETYPKYFIAELEYKDMYGYWYDINEHFTISSVEKFQLQYRFKTIKNSDGDLILTGKYEY